MSEGTKDKYRQICDVYTTGYMYTASSRNEGIKETAANNISFYDHHFKFHARSSKKDIKRGKGGTSIQKNRNCQQSNKTCLLDGI